MSGLWVPRFSPVGPGSAPAAVGRAPTVGATRSTSRPSSNSHRRHPPGHRSTSAPSVSSVTSASAAAPTAISSPAASAQAGSALTATSRSSSPSCSPRHLRHEQPRPGERRGNAGLWTARPASATEPRPGSRAAHRPWRALRAHHIPTAPTADWRSS